MEYIAPCMDLALLAILILTVVRCTRTGLVQSVSKILSVILAAFGASQLKFVLDDILQRKFFDPLVTGAVEERLGEVLQNVDQTAEAAAQALTDAVNRLIVSLQSAGISLSVLSLPEKEADPALYAERLTDSVAEPIAAQLSQICAFLLLFLLFYAVLRVLFSLLAGVMKLPLLNGVNRLAGGIFGLVLGAAYMWLAAQVLSLVLGILCAKGILPAEVSGGPLLQFLTGKMHTPL